MNRSAKILAKSKGPKSRYKNSTVHKAAQELGSKGGRKGGPARAEKLPYKQIVEIASHAANMRWGNPCDCRYCK